VKEGFLMTNRLYVGNLNAKVNETALLALFGTIGKVTSVLIPTDHQTGARKNYAFVEMETIEEAQAAAAGLNGQMISGRALKVTEIQAAMDSKSMPHVEGGGYRYQKRGWGS
jgi:cold-inducible RNA-binding protein